ncbi:MAG: hypothetical protein M1450_04975 [Patescibacteria group bacterium]|nr:hypothetical protein [Patescibacteria group bacterium]
MPDNEQSDIDFQPKTKEYSYSASSQKKNNSLKDQATFGTGITGGILVLFIFFFTLNYFNVLSLSSLYPRMFGFLPHKPFETSSTNTNNQIPTPTPEAIESGLATKEQIEKYQTYVRQKGFADALSYSNDSKSWSVEGLYAGYENNIVNVVTNKGLVKFPISEATGFETIIIVKGSKEEGGGTFRTAGTYKLDKFLQTVTTGKFLQIYYTKLSNKDIITTRAIYYPDLR